MTIFAKNQTIINQNRVETGVTIYVERPYGIDRFYAYLGGMAGRFYLLKINNEWKTTHSITR